MDDKSNDCQFFRNSSYRLIMAYKIGVSSGGAKYVFSLQTGSGSPAASTLYYMKQGAAFTGGISLPLAGEMMISPITGTITDFYGSIQCSPGSSEVGSVQIRIGVLLQQSFNITFDSSTNTFSQSGLSISLNAGNQIVFTVQTPAWTVNPTGCIFSGTVVVQ